jgi:vitamin B12 transporter
MDLSNGGSRDDYGFIVGGRYALGEHSAMRASVARQIRFPTLRDLYAADRGNPDLEPEQTNSYEIGLQHLFGATSAFGEVVLFRTDADDFIERIGDNPAMNLEEYRFQGIELTGGYRPTDSLQLALGYTYLDSENRSPDRDTDKLQNRPRNKYSLTGDYDASWGSRLRVELLHLDGSYALSRTTPTTALELDSYTVVNVVLSHAFRDGRYSLYLRAQNLLDEDYVESYGFEQPGRTVFVGLDVRL